MTHAFLADMSRIAIGGPEAADFLQGLITTDLKALTDGSAHPGALLTPQGKVMFFFLISATDVGFSVEIQQDQTESFIKRLTLYRLRAKVEIGRAEPGGTALYWNENAPENAVKDARFEKAGVALWRVAGGNGTREAYDALRADCGIAEPGFDFALSDAFPHDILMDKSGGVSFKKGCYIGQEVVSRMQHRSTARRRLVQVAGEIALPATGAEIVAGGKTLGALGTVSGKKGLAIVRTDRAGAAIAAGLPILAGDCAVTLTLPVWSGLEFPSAESEE